MRKRRFVGGIFALCLALSVAGCGKSSEEKQAANYYQNELGLDKEDAEYLAHELYGEDGEGPGVTGEDGEESGVTEEGSKETVIEPLPELVNSEWYEQKLQIYDMVFNYDHMAEEDIRKIVGGSAYDVELTEDFDKNGEVCLSGLVVNGELVAQLWKQNRSSDDDLVKYGFMDEEYYYRIGYGSAYITSNWYDKASVEFKNLQTRDDVLAYLAANGFVEVDEKQATYRRSEDFNKISPAYGTPVEYADVPHYYCKGVQSITLYRIHKVGETDQVIEHRYNFYDYHFSGAHLNLVNYVTFEFNTDGTIKAGDAAYYWRNEDFRVDGDLPGCYQPGCYSMDMFTKYAQIMGEQID